MPRLTVKDTKSCWEKEKAFCRIPIAGILYTALAG